MNLDFNKICRLCLRYCDESYDLKAANGVKHISSDILEAIKSCYCLQVDLNDGLPTQICQPCVSVLHYFCMSKKNAFVSELLLKNILYLRNRSNENTTKETQISSTTNLQTYSTNVKTFPYSTSNVRVAQPIQNITSSNLKSSKPKSISYIVKKKKKHKSKEHSLTRSKVSNGVVKRKKNKKSKKQKEKEIIEILDDSDSYSPTTTLDNNKGTKSTSEETKIVKVIGTVIDEGNILSPDVKRPRKTVLNSFAET